MVLCRGSSRGGSFSDRQLSQPDVLVRRFRSGLGSLVAGQSLAFSQPQGVAGSLERSYFFLESSVRMCSRGVFCQHHSGVVSSEAKRDIFTGPQRGVIADTSLGREEGDHQPSSVCFRSEQRSRRRSVSPQSGDRGKVDSATGLLLVTKEVAGGSGPSCILVESPLWCLFCSGVGSHGCGYRFHAAVKG